MASFARGGSLETCRVEDIYEDLKDRRNERSRFASKHALVRRILEGDAGAFRSVALPREHDIPEDDHLQVANIMLQAVEALSRRVAVPPTITDLPADGDSKTALKNAKINTQAKRTWFARNQGPLMGYQLSRWLLGFSEAPILVTPDWDTRMPCFTERDPLTFYPNGSDWRPQLTDAIFCYEMSKKALRKQYPYAPYDPKWNEVSANCEIVEHYCESCWIVFSTATNTMGRRMFTVLASGPNPTGACPVVAPRLITAGSRAGAFNSMVGLMAAQSRLMVMSLIAAERGVFPQRYLHGEVIGQINDGPDAYTQMERDSRVTQLQFNSSYQYNQEIDRIERAMRISGEYPAQLSGETPSTLATGRGNQTLLSATVDQGVRERQLILGQGWQEAFERGVLISKAYWPEARIPIHVKDKKHTKLTSYTPSKMTEGTTRVEYGLMSGSDVAQTTVILGQMATLGMSEESFFDMHPLIGDKDEEIERRTKQDLRKALLASIQEKIATGQLDPLAVAKMDTYITEGMDLSEAYTKAVAETTQAVEEGAPELLPAAAAPQDPSQLLMQQTPPAPRQVVQTMLGDI